MANILPIVGFRYLELLHLTIFQFKKLQLNKLGRRPP